MEDFKHRLLNSTRLKQMTKMTGWTRGGQKSHANQGSVVVKNNPNILYYERQWCMARKVLLHHFKL